MRSSTAVVAAAGLFCCVLSGCSFSAGVNNVPTVSKDALQEDISQRLAEASEQPESVTCKGDLVGEVGKTVRCEVVMSATNSFEPIITVTGVDGSCHQLRDDPGGVAGPTRAGGVAVGRRGRGIRGEVGRLRVRP